MKIADNPTKEKQDNPVQRITNEPGPNATATIVDNRPRTVYQRQLRKTMEAHTAAKTVPMKRKTGRTGLPDNLKTGIEHLSGYAMDDVKVHYNSPKPAQLQAHAYAQGTNIHLAPGQEKHLPHEAWHVVQQKQGRVKPTMQFKSGVNINDDAGLEQEADAMGLKAVDSPKKVKSADKRPITVRSSTIQRKVVLQDEFAKPESIFGRAIKMLKAVVADDLTKQEMSDYDAKHKKFRWMKALLNSQVEIIFENHSSADLAGLTKLECENPVKPGEWLDFDDPSGINYFILFLSGQEKSLKELLKGGEIKKMRIVVSLSTRWKDFGKILQTLTHELMVHALDLFGFIEGYEHRKDVKLDGSNLQHFKYHKGENKEYVLLKNRLLKRLNETEKEDFEGREIADKSHLVSTRENERPKGTGVEKFEFSKLKNGRKAVGSHSLKGSDRPVKMLLSDKSEEERKHIVDELKKETNTISLSESAIICKQEIITSLEKGDEENLKIWQIRQVAGGYFIDRCPDPGPVNNEVPMDLVLLPVKKCSKLSVIGKEAQTYFARELKKDRNNIFLSHQVNQFKEDKEEIIDALERGDEKVLRTYQVQKIKDGRFWIGIYRKSKPVHATDFYKKKWVDALSNLEEEEDQYPF